MEQFDMSQIVWDEDGLRLNGNVYPLDLLTYVPSSGRGMPSINVARAPESLPPDHWQLLYQGRPLCTIEVCASQKERWWKFRNAIYNKRKPS